MSDNRPFRRWPKKFEMREREIYRQLGRLKSEQRDLETARKVLERFQEYCTGDILGEIGRLQICGSAQSGGGV